MKKLMVLERASIRELHQVSGLDEQTAKDTFETVNEAFERGKQRVLMKEGLKQSLKPKRRL